MSDRRAVRYEIRPLGTWTDPVTAPRKSSGCFRAGWQATLDLLCREVQALDGDLVVLQIDVTEAELRRDGMLRVGAKVDFPGVRASFSSRHGPLSYATDVYESTYYSAMSGWQANIRAIALALEALRAVDRYGVSATGQQYRGWQAIEAGPGARFEAAKLLALAGCGTPAEVLYDPQRRATAFREACRKYHPDRGGDSDFFRRLVEA
jgi:hypothetical protein